MFDLVKDIVVTNATAYCWKMAKNFIISAIEKNSTVCDRNDTQIQSHNDTQDYLIKLLSPYFTVPQLGNCDIDFFVFCNRFRITSLKFLKLKRVWNVAKKFWTVKEQKHEMTKLDRNWWNYHSLSAHIVKFYQNLLNFVKFHWIQSNGLDCSPLCSVNASTLLATLIDFANTRLVCLIPKICPL